MMNVESVISGFRVSPSNDFCCCFLFPITTKTYLFTLQLADELLGYAISSSVYKVIRNRKSISRPGYLLSTQEPIQLENA